MFVSMSRPTEQSTLPDAQGHFGPYGGRYVPETLMHPLQQLEEEYFKSQQDPEFQRELNYYLRGLPHLSPLGKQWLWILSFFRERGLQPRHPSYMRWGDHAR